MLKQKLSVWFPLRSKRANSELCIDFKSFTPIALVATLRATANVSCMFSCGGCHLYSPNLSAIPSTRDNGFVFLFYYSIFIHSSYWFDAQRSDWIEDIGVLGVRASTQSLRRTLWDWSRQLLSKLTCSNTLYAVDVHAGTAHAVPYWRRNNSRIRSLFVWRKVCTAPTYLNEQHLAQ